MKTHEISIDQVSDFKWEVILASSSKELKNLKIVSNINNGDLRSYFLVEQRNNSQEHKVIFKEETMFLDVAISFYNNLY